MFELVWPYALCLLPLPFLVIYVFPPCRNKSSRALKVPFYEELHPLVSTVASDSKQKWVFLWLIWLLLVFALSGPQWVGEPQPVKQEGRNIMLALDLSGSMRMNDMKINNQTVTRLDVVKQTAREFIKKRLGDRIGLILFGTRAYLQTPLTFDRQTVLHMLNDATVGLAGQTTSIGDAIGLAIKRLQQTPKKSRVLILLTDGVNNSGVLTPKQAADIAKSHQVKIYTIGLGADKMIVQSIFGPQAYNPSLELDEKGLKEIAHLTGGEFFRAKDYKQLENIYQTINALEPVNADSKISRPRKDLYYIPVCFSLLVFFLLSFAPLLRLSIRQTQLRSSHG